MNVIICGAGEVGYNIARLLSDEKNQITIIDHDEDRIEQISNKLDVRTLIGYASHPKILKEAEADKSDMIIAVTQSDEINMISCQIASALFSVPIKIARDVVAINPIRASNKIVRVIAPIVTGIRYSDQPA